MEWAEAPGRHALATEHRNVQMPSGQHLESMWAREVHRGHGKDPGLEAGAARGVLDRTPIEAVHPLGSSQPWCI